MLLLALSFVYFRKAPQPEERSVRFQVPLPEKWSEAIFRLSPEGRYLAIGGNPGQRGWLWVRPLDVLEARPLPGTEGASLPFWSPDSASIAYFVRGKLMRISLAGGPPQTICEVPNGLGGTWNRDGVIVFAPEAGKPLYRVPAAGGVPTPVTKLAGSFAHAFPQFLPDGERVLYLDISGREKATSLYVGSLDGKPPVALPINGLGATYAPLGAASRIGYLFFLRASTLVAEAFDPDGLLPSSETAPLAGLPGTADFGYLPPFSVSKRRNWTRALRICHSLSTPRTDHSEVGSTIPLTLPGWVEPEEPLWRRVRPEGAGREGRNRPRPALPPYAP